MSYALVRQLEPEARAAPPRGSVLCLGGIAVLTARVCGEVCGDAAVAVGAVVVIVAYGGGGYVL